MRCQHRFKRQGGKREQCAFTATHKAMAVRPVLGWIAVFLGCEHHARMVAKEYLADGRSERTGIEAIESAE